MELRARAGEQAHRLLLHRLPARQRFQAQVVRQELPVRLGVDRLVPLGLLARRPLLVRPLQLHPQAWVVEDAARQHLLPRAY
jgi:hypothetical protein